MTIATDKLDHNAAAIKRWRTRLKRAMSMLDKLEKQRKRLEAKAVRVSVPAHPTVDSETTLGTVPPKPEPLAVTIMREVAGPVDTTIPEFLRRGKAAQSAADQVIAEAIKAEQQATKAAKAKGRIAKMKAKQSGETRRMPLSGKAALDAIRNA